MIFIQFAVLQLRVSFVKLLSDGCALLKDVSTFTLLLATLLSDLVAIRYKQFCTVLLIVGECSENRHRDGRTFVVGRM
jgi:hypothetical protein